MLGFDPSISCKRFSGLRFAPPENDGSQLFPASFAPAFRNRVGSIGSSLMRVS